MVCNGFVSALQTMLRRMPGPALVRAALRLLGASGVLDRHGSRFFFFFFFLIIIIIMIIIISKTKNTIGHGILILRPQNGLPNFLDVASS